MENGDLALTGDNAFGGGIGKFGSGTLTLSGNNSYSGPTGLYGGSLVLSGAGMLSGTSALSMAGGTTFDFGSMAATSLSLPRLDVLGKTAVLAAGGGAKTLNLSGGVLTFDLGGTVAGDVMLSGDNGLVISPATRVVLFNAPALTAIGQRITLVDDLADPPASGFTDRFALVNFKKYFLGLDGDDLVLSLVGASSYRLEDELFFDPLRQNNRNLRSGSDYLDRLAALTAAGSLDPNLMSLLDHAFHSSLALGGRDAARSLEQVYGGYAAYARSPLRLAGDRIAQLWHGRNHLFLDEAVFSERAVADYHPTASASLSPAAFGPARAGVFWGGGFGDRTRQQAADNLSGYTYDSHGAALGYEYQNQRLRLGGVAAYSRGDIRVDILKWRNKPEVLNLALYGVYAHESGVHVQGGVGYGHAWNSYDVDMLLGGRKSGSYGTDGWSADFEIGYTAQLPRDYVLIPSVCIEYDRIHNDDWTEKIHNNPNLVANAFAGGHDHGLDVPLGLRFGKAFRFGDRGGFVAPELLAAWVWQADASRPTVVSGYSGAPGGASVYGVDPGDSHWRLGAAVSGRLNERVDFRADYTFQTRSGFRQHAAMASVGITF